MIWMSDYSVDKEVWFNVLKRDEYMCLNCNSEEELQPAHYQSRSQLGLDTEANIMTLCFKCHRKLHDGRLIVKKIDERFFFRQLPPR